MLTLITMNQPIIEPKPNKRKREESKKNVFPVDKLNDQSLDQKMKYLRSLLALKEFKFMLEYIKWSIINHKKLANPTLIQRLK